MKFYLSPSNQPNNSYVLGNTTEKAQMEAVAMKVQRLLATYDCNVKMATLSMGIDKSKRPTEAKNNGCDFYFAIHSNATGGKPPCSATGAVGIYHPNSAKSKEFATALVKELREVCPIESNRSSSVVNGMLAFNGSGYGEIRSPMQLGIPAVLLEVDFHDNPTTAKWIIDNKDTVAKAIVNAMVSTFNIKMNAVPGTPGQPTTDDSLFRVQTGAFKNKANAEALQGKLKTLGFDTYIVQVGGYFKVQVGAFSVRANADAMMGKLKAAGHDAFITTEKGTPSEPAKKSITEIAKEVLNGKWGNGQDRVNRLKAAGYDSSAVQAAVNNLLK